MAETDIDEVLDIIGFGYMNVLMVLTCSMLSIYVNNELIAISPILLSIDCEFSLTRFELSMLAIAAFVGLILSSHYAGYKTDKVGRRTMVIYSLIFSLLSSVTSIAMRDFYWLLFWRFMTGCCISGAGINHVTYITEYTKISWRPRMVTLMTYAVTAGAIYVPFMATLMRPLDAIVGHIGSYTIRTWRFSLLTHLLPGVLAFVGMWLLPETAKFMLSVGEKERAYETLDRLCRRNRRQSLKSFGVTSVTQSSGKGTLTDSKYFLSRIWQDTKTVYNRTYMLPVLHITAILSGFSAIGSGFGLWFAKMSHYLSTDELILCEKLDNCDSGNKSDNHCFQPINYHSGMILSATSVGCCVFISLLMICLSRRLILTCTATIAAVCGVSLNFITLKTPQLVAKMLYLSLCNTSIPLAGSVITDIVPTHLRGKAAALCYMVARMAIVGTSLLHGNLMCDFCLVYFNFFVDFAFAIAVLSYFLPV